MELRQLRYLCAVVEERNFTRAAEKLYVSQSALSQQIQSLEREVGTILVDRSRNGAHLTPAGEVLVHSARRILQELDGARLAIDELAGLQRGKLTIGTVQTVNAYLMPSVIAAYVGAYPGIQLSVLEWSADEIERGVEQGRVDIGIGFLPTVEPSLDFELLFEEALVLVVPRDHPLAQQDAISLAALDGIRLVMFSTAFCTRRLWDDYAAQAGIITPVPLELNTVAGLLATVHQLGMPTILPELALMNQTELVGVRLINPTPVRQIGLLTRRGGYQSAAARAFGEVVRDITTLEKSTIGS